MNKETLNNEMQEIIREIIAETLNKMGFEAEVKTKTETVNDAEMAIFNIKTADSNFLIGQYGVNLQSLQHIIRLLVRKKISDKINFTVDVNGYRQEKNNSLAKMAQEMSQECLAENREIVLRPMTAYERRLVHLELSKNPEVVSESIGEGEGRRIVIRPARISS